MLRRHCGGRRELTTSAVSLTDVLQFLRTHHFELYNSVCNETGALRQHVNLFVNSSLVCRREAPDEPLRQGDDVFIMPSVSGG